MTNKNVWLFESGGRKRPPLNLWLAVALSTIALICLQSIAFAHAEPEQASPPINGVVATPPTLVEIWFSEEVETEGTTILVIGPGGIQVDLGDAKVDLDDPERKHVTVSLRSGLESGAYTVQWHSVSAEDGDEDQGGYLFTVGDGTPVASPVGTPEGSPVNEEQSPNSTASSSTEPLATVEVVGTPATSPAAEEDDFDSQAFGLAVVAGLIAAVGIYLFWRAVRPKNPMFRE